MEGGKRKRETSLSKKRDSLGRRLHLRRSLEDRKVDQEDAAAGEGPHAGKGGEGDGGGEEEELCVCVWGGGWRGEGVGAFFLWVRRRGFAPAPPSRFPARSVPLTRLFSTCVSTAACHSSPRDPSDAKRARKTWRFGVRGMRERKRERESDTQLAGVRFFFCAPFSTHGKARYDGPCRQSRLMLAKQQVSRLHSAGETDVFGPEVCASERERVCERCPRRRHAGVGDASLSASLSARRALLADSPGSGRYQRRLRGDNPPDSPPSPDRDRRGKRMSKRRQHKRRHELGPSC